MTPQEKAWNDARKWLMEEWFGSDRSKCVDEYSEDVDCVAKLILAARQDAWEEGFRAGITAYDAKTDSHVKTNPYPEPNP